MNHRTTAYSIFFISNFYKLILFENQIQTTSTSPYRTQVQPAASFLVCSLIFIEYKITFVVKSTGVIFFFYPMINVL